MKTILWLALLIAVCIFTYNGPCDVYASVLIKQDGIRLDQQFAAPLTVRLDKLVDAQIVDGVGAAKAHGTLVKGQVVVVIGTSGSRAVVLTQSQRSHTYLVPVDQMPESVKSVAGLNSDHKNCVHPGKLVCELKR